MTIQLNATQERRLNELSAANGVAVDVLAQQAIDQFLTYRDHLGIAIQEGRDAATRGELLDHKDVVARVERLLAS